MNSGIQKIMGVKLFCMNHTLHDTMMMDTCHYTFVQMHRTYSSKTEPSWKPWTLSDYDVPL